jgi:putative ABC transport system permease protein
MTTLTEEDAQAIQKECPAVAYISPGARSGGQVVAGNLNWGTSIEGTGSDYLEIRKWPIEYGEFYSEQDVKAAAKVCVLGATVANNLFPETSPIGQTVRVRNMPARVIGVLSKKGQNAMGQDQDDVVLAPYTTVLRRLSHSPYLRQVLVSATSPATITEAERQITELLRMRYKIASMADDFTVATSRIWLRRHRHDGDLTILLASTRVSLLVGGIGIMNIMLVSVTERTRRSASACPSVRGDGTS